MENRFSKKNIMLYRLKCLNTRNKEYEEPKEYDYKRIHYKK